MERFQKEIAYCTFCPKMCRFSCPVGEVLHTELMTPTGKMTVLYLLEKEKLSYEDVKETVFKGCILCLCCQNYCRHRIDIPQIMRELRNKFVGEKIFPEEVKNFLKILKEYRNPYQKDLKKKLKEFPRKYFENKKEIVYFPGCTQIEYYIQDIEEIIKIFEKLDVEFSISDSECCGFYHFNFGYEEEFLKLRKENFEKFKNRKIVSSCPECVYVLREKYNLKNIFHITEFLYPYLTKDIFSNPQKFEERIIYYDSCYSGRYLNLYEIPRKILERFTKSQTSEFLRNREESNCCGYTFRFVYPEISKKITLRCIEDVEEATIVVSCPSCKRSFQEILGEEKVKYISNIVSFSL